MLQRHDQNGQLWRDEFRATVALAWPLILTNVAQAMIGATDTLMLGWAGAATLAAGALGTNLYLLFLVFGMGLVSATSPMIAKELGEKAHSVRDVRRTVRQALWAAAIVVVPSWLILWNAGAILKAIGQNPELAEQAQQFVRVLQWGLLPSLGYLVLRAYFAALQRPAWSLIVVAFTIALNAVLDYGLIFGKLGFPALGLIGAGIASSTASTLGFVGMVLVVRLHPRFRRYHLLGHFWHPDWSRLGQVFRLGLPIAMTLFFEVAVFIGAVFLMGLIGANSVAAHAVAIQIASLTFMVPLGISQAATVRVGLAYGRRDAAGIARAGWTALVAGVGFMIAMAGVMLAIPDHLVEAFLDPGDARNAAVIPLAISFLFVAALFQIVDGAQVVGAGVLRGLHDTKVPMIYAAIGYWAIGLVTSVTLGFGLGWQGVGIWAGLAIGLAAVAGLLIARWLRREQLRLTEW